MHNLWKNDRAGKILPSFKTTLTQCFNDQWGSLFSFSFFFLLSLKSVESQSRRINWSFTVQSATKQRLPNGITSMLGIFTSCTFGKTLVK